ncbi:MAG TPA: Rieske (2Fe-2S) protein [Vicinamibacterales bacterium]|jgi:nitrite reductase/ring-hydroxylating ferredoxin subunit
MTRTVKGTLHPNVCALCNSCAGDQPSRRRFIGIAAGGVFGLLGLLGLSSDALALPIRAITAEPAPVGADEKRYPIPATDSVNVDHAESLIVARVQRHVYVFNLACPHQQAAVRWLPEDHRFQCTKHDSKYTPQGVYMSGRATRNLDRFVIRRDGDAVVVEMDRVIQSDKDPSGWAAATITVA